MSHVLPSKQRLLSLDVLRGLIMVLLAAKSCGIIHALKKLDTQETYQAILRQFSHAEWQGLTFWDLVQPGFMLMAGSALYISWKRKQENNVSPENNLKHILHRSFRLFILGTALHCVYAGELVWELWNVLTQLSVTTVIAYLIIRKSYTFQIIFSFILLLFTEVLYRYMEVPGFDQPFVKSQNFGAYTDLLLMGKINTGGWVAINFIPTAAHTIWGVLAGKLLVSDLRQHKKIVYLVTAAVVALISGYALDISATTPIIKRISTSSFVLASGGWVLLMMAFLYWLNDIKKISKYAWILTVVGMNAIFIYLFFETIGAQWFNNFAGIFVGGILNLAGLPATIAALVTTLLTLAAEWYLCYWLYQQKIFFKL